ncbi:MULTISPECIES: dihydrolipoyl dehydrogenase [unclassified Roseibium]|uniref:dihydrolipoyl dehydrogenase n=1 Tax=unclassified Roseibium TaxID=2629323 RepID=UPI00273F9088|nr:MULTISPECIES: dihydrolipoyl dehydrogenase [unclassified Roseibium]
MPDLTCDVAVIGAGTAGLAAERAARDEGAETRLIDPEFAGTVCAEVGCMPSKLLIAAAGAAEAVRDAETFGIRATPEIDGPAVMARVQNYRDQFVDGVQDSIDALPESVRIKARARFTSPNSLLLDDDRTISARSVVVATGSHPMVPDAYTDLGDRLLTNRTVFDLPRLPDRLAVVGSGAIGVELAQAFARLGVEVALFERGSVLSSGRTPEVKHALLAALKRDMTVHLDADPAPKVQHGKVEMHWENRCKTFDYILLATGRPPTLDGLNLPATGARLDEKGRPDVNPSTFQIGHLPVFMAGDATGNRPVLHEASTDGTIAGRNAARFPAVVASDPMVAFSLTFSDPPVATIGDGPDTATLTGSVSYAEQGRARVEDKAHGLVQLHADGSGCLTGADLCAPAGEHLAHLIAWAIENRLTAHQVLGMPFYHPTLEEGLKDALREICAQSGTPAPENRDRAHAPGDF